MSRKRPESTFLSKSARRFAMSSVIDGSFKISLVSATELCRGTSMAAAKPLARCGAVEGALASGFATAALHNLW
ncbi:hypothetical protein [Mesorhizobium sp. M1216]|uniref:hypothetical protein n=1 Tax=Mesorhizobium sp. M1216 TaxID=2957069 RepID=UPI003335E022